MKSSSRLFCVVAAVCSVAVFTATAVEAATPKTLASFVERLSNGSVPSTKSVEQLTGNKLRAEAGTDSFAVYSSGAKKLKDARLTRLELRVARKGVAVTAGPLVIVSVDNQGRNCIDRKEVLEAFGPLTLAQVASGSSINAKTFYSRIESWGTVSLGFSAASPDCLASISFAHLL